MWLTGSTIIQAIGFHKLFDVDFAVSTFVNTFALCLTLKTQPDMSPEDAVSYYTELIIKHLQKNSLSILFIINLLTKL